MATARPRTSAGPLLDLTGQVLFDLALGDAPGRRIGIGSGQLLCGESDAEDLGEELHDTRSRSWVSAVNIACVSTRRLLKMARAVMSSS